MANSYVDDINVKISEKYKPPCRISMPMSYSQRLTLNKQLQDNRPAYDFQLEKNVLEKMKEWKDCRKNLAEERTERLKLARKQFDEKIHQENLDKLATEQAQAKLLEETNKVNTDSDLPTQNTYFNPLNTNTELQTQNPYLSTENADQSQQHYLSQSSASQNQQNYVTKNGILMPIPFSSYSENTSNILKPIPMSNNFEPQKPSVKPFNLSDFESDTSSPFDNMELKSINDLEELAQVLKSDRTSFQPNMYQNTSIFQDPTNYSNSTKSYSQLPSNTKSYSNFTQDITPPSRGYLQNSNVRQDSRAYNHNSAGSQCSINYNQIPSSYSQINTNFNPISTTFSQYNTPYHLQNTLSYNPSAVSTYSNINSYFYNTPQVTSQVQLGPPSNTSYTPYVSSATQLSMQRSSCKSVPDLVKSVEKELDNTHLKDTSNLTGTGQDRSKNTFYTTNVPIPTRPKSTDAVYHKTKVKDDIFNPFDRLSVEQKEVCRNVSVMGFPLDRVARVCLVFGSDQKMIVDHLLALSDLLDLGFPEKDASEALTKNDNDRDKALDVLIS